MARHALSAPGRRPGRRRAAGRAAGRAAPFWLAATLSAGTGQAQVPRDTFHLEELVVTATRVPIPRDAVTASVSVISGEQLRARGYVHAADALRHVAGVAVARNGSFGGVTQLYVRGGENDYTRVLVDGVPINEPGGRVDLGWLSVENVERIEVVRGPVSVLYGSDAVTGVVQIFTRRGEGPPRVRAEAEGGTLGTSNVAAGLHGGGSVADYSVALSRYGTSGVYEFNNEFRNWTASAAVGLRPDSRSRGTATFRLHDAEFHYPTDGGGAVVDRNAFQETRTVTVGAELARQLAGRLEARMLIGGSRVETHIIDQPDGPGDTVGFFASRFTQDLRRGHAEALLNLHLPGSTVLTLGGELERQWEDAASFSESEFGPFRDSTDLDRWNRGYYLQALASKGPLALNAGGRLDDNEAFGTFFTYRAGAAVRLRATRLRASAGTAFKEPTFLDNYATGFARGNRDLDPERSRSWEAGLEQEWGGSATAGDRPRRATAAANLTYFRQSFRDLIQYTANPPGGPTAPNYFNVAAARSDGAEVGLRLQPSAAVELASNYTWLSTEVTDAGFEADPDANFVRGARLLRRPEHQLAVSLGARVGGGAVITGMLSHVGEREDLDFAEFPARRVRLSSYRRVDLSAQYPLIGRSAAHGVLITVRVENALGAEYQEIVNFRSPGRMLFVGARMGTPLGR